MARRICCGNVTRGTAIYNGKIYVPIIDGRLAALDAATGKVLWTVQTTPPNQPYSVTIAPRIVKNKVIVGNAGSEYPVRGFISAYDTETGKMVWRFYTVPGDPSKPYENPALKKAADTWSGEFWKLGGGGTVWDGMAYDPDANLFYFGTGNGGPWPEELRQSKGKDNLYVASILAINPDNGQLKWHYQAVPGDSWDFDQVGQLTLAEIKINGKDRKVIMQAAKNGFFYVLDRTHWRIHFGGAVCPGQLGQWLRRQGKADLQSGCALRIQQRFGESRTRRSAITGRRCRSIPIRAWFTFRPHRPALSRTRLFRTSIRSRHA